MSDLLQMSVAQVEKMASLNADLFYEVLKRLDGPTLASAAFCSISKEERLWEYVCSSKWPSTNREDVKFYADCFPPYCNEEVSKYRRNDYLEYPEEWTESEYYGDMDEFESISPSDFGSLVDIRYKDKIIGSMFFGALHADGFNGCFYNCDLLTHADADYDNDGEVFLSAANGLPPITSMETEKRDGKLWRGLRDGLRLSWIVANGKIKQAANLACCYPLGAQRHWPTDKDFTSFLVCQVVECILSLKLRVICTESEGVQTTLKLTELIRRHGRQLLQRKKQFASAQGSAEPGPALRNWGPRQAFEWGRLDRLCILSGIAALVSFCYYVL
ncbi:unnamed protein product [Malus baccata var. baccata]